MKTPEQIAAETMRGAHWQAVDPYGVWEEHRGAELVAAIAAAIEADRAQGPIRRGATLYGFCNGYFGRDSYADKTVIAAGKRPGGAWIVAEEAGGLVVTATDVPPGLIDAWLEDDAE